MKKIIFLLLTICCLLLSGCKPTQLIIHDIEYRDKLKHDSIYVEKNKVITITRNGDTVFVDRLNTEYKYKYLHLTDSIYKYIEKPIKIKELVPIQVERKFYWYESVFMIVGKWLSVLFLLLVIYLAIKYFNDIKHIFIKKL